HSASRLPPTRPVGCARCLAESEGRHATSSVSTRPPPSSSRMLRRISGKGPPAPRRRSMAGRRSNCSPAWWRLPTGTWRRDVRDDPGADHRCQAEGSGRAPPGRARERAPRPAALRRAPPAVRRRPSRGAGSGGDRRAEARLAAARETGLDVLVEVHDEAELAWAAAAGATLIGINNRDLGSFAVTLATTERLAPRAPAGALVVAESGIRSPADLHRMLAAG